MSRFCHECTRANLEDESLPPCEILGRALGYNMNDPLYPKEWVQDENGPRCTAFTTLPAEEIYRCPDTADLFEGD